MSNLRNFAEDRAKFINSKWVKWRGELSNSDQATPNQISRRVDAIMFYIKKFNYMYPISYDKAVVAFLTYPELETGWVNWASRKDKDGNRYGVLDNGESFGYLSLQWDTCKWIADVKGWEYSEYKLQKDTYEQAKFGVWFFYHNLQQKEGDIGASLGAYNFPGLGANKERWRRYTMEALGRYVYLFKKYKGESLYFN
jgi:hypothetical protein